MGELLFDSSVLRSGTDALLLVTTARWSDLTVWGLGKGGGWRVWMESSKNTTVSPT